MSTPSLWRVLAKRTRAVWPLGLACLGAVLLAATLLATGPLYADAAAQAGLERKLADADAEQAGLDVTARVDPESYAATSARIEQELRRTLPGLGPVERVAESDSVAAPDGRRYILGFVEGIEEHAALRSGRWPRASADGLEAAASAEAAERTGLAVGDTLRLPAARTVAGTEVRVVGLYDVADAGAAVWWNDELALDGVRGRDTPTYGPLLVTEPGLLAVAERFRASWRARPEPGAFAVDGLQLAADSVAGLEARLGEDVPRGVAPPVVSTGLPALLDESRRELRVARSGVLVPLAQLALLAAYGLVFVAALIRRRRRREDELLLTRGANPRSLVLASAVEALLLAALATLAAPWAAALAIEVVSAVGPLASARVDLEPQVDAQAYALALAGAFGCLFALLVPALRDRDDGRNAQPGFFARTGLDVALLVAAAVALWQLRAEGAPVVAGEGELDVLLVAVPAIGIFAAAVLAGRLLPPVLALLARAAAARPGAVAALATRRLARTASEHRPAAVLLVAAMAIGTFAAAYASTWDATQRQRAALQVGADVLVPDDRRSDSYVPIGRASAFAATPGVAAASPLAVERLRVGDETVRLVAVDAARTPAAPVGAEGGRQQALLRELAQRRPDSRRPRIPAGARSIAFSARTTVEPLPAGVEAPTVVIFGAPHQVSVDPEPTLAAVVRDANGVLHRLDAGPLREGETTLSVELGPEPLHPLELAGLEVAYRVPAYLNRTVEVELTSPLLRDGAWSATTSPLAAPLRPALARVTSGSGVNVGLETGASELDRTGGTAALQPEPPAPRPLPVIAGTGLLDALGAQVGNVIEVDAPGGTRRIEIVGTLTNFATVVEGDRFLVADLPTLFADRYSQSQVATRPDDWILDLENGSPAAALAALSRPPLAVERASSREQVERTLASDPLAVATSGALWLGFFAAALFATAAFAVAGAARSRRHLADASLLAGLGLERKGTRLLLVLEDAILALLATVIGVGVGTALALLVLPAVAFTETGQAAVPPPSVEVPWATVAALAGAVTGLIILAALVRADAASRASIAAELRAPAA